MKRLWALLFAVDFIFLAYLAWVLPERVIGKTNLQGVPTSYMAKPAFILLNGFLLLANNVLFAWLSRLRPATGAFRYVNIPYKKHWMETEERRNEARRRLSWVAAATAVYVNGVSLAILYQTYWYHFRDVPCPRPLVLFGGIMAAGAALVVATILSFRPPQ